MFLVTLGLGCGGGLEDGLPLPHGVASEAASLEPGFRVELRGEGRLVTVDRPWPDAREPLAYFLVPRGSGLTAEAPKGSTLVEVPLGRVGTTAAPHIAQLEALGALGSLKAHAGLDLVYSPAVQLQYLEGSLAEIGVGGTVDAELLVDSEVEAIFFNALGREEYDRSARWRTLGITPILTAEWTEESPLQRAAWIRFMGLFLGFEDRAESILGEVRDHYLKIQALTSGTANRPRVLLGAPFRGTWWMPGRETDPARLIRDAGGDYLWPDLEGVRTHALDLETVLDRADRADVWLRPGVATGLAQVQALDERLSLFSAFETGEVYGPTRRLSTGGGNDIWETGSLRPDLVLVDLVKIFHPELLRSEEFTFYERLH